MILKFDTSLAEGYKSASQIARVLTEDCLARNMYCPICGEVSIRRAEPKEMKSVKDKRKRRRQAIVSLMGKDSHIKVETIAEKLDVHKRTILRDIEELKKNHVIERVGGDFGGE